MVAGPADLPQEADLRAALTDQIARGGRAISGSGVWLMVGDPAFRPPGQGWKIHLSARPATLIETIRRALPALLATPCHFKVIRSGRLLRDLNSSNSHPGSVGKAATIYAAPEDMADLARRLADDLAGLAGPRIHSDRRVRPGSVVHYRYGPIRSRYEVNEDGDLELVVTDPRGRTCPGAAGDSFWQPSWDADPLTGETASDREPGRGPDREPDGGTEGPPVMLGGRYRVERGLTRNAKGCVYRAVDTTTGQPVILKEARAYVNEDSHGRDSRIRLRNERYVLELLSDLAGVPRVIDHFRHDDQEYLAITDMGALALGQDVAENGLYAADPAPRGRSLPGLAAALLELLDEVHRRGVLVRDLAPANVVLDAAGRPCLVDFEISHAAGPRIFGWTPGYSPPEQERDEPAGVEADYYSLGATLFYAATGLPPTWLAGDPGNHDVERAAAVLNGRGGMSGTILGLLDTDPARRRTAAESIRSGRFRIDEADNQTDDQVNDQTDDQAGRAGDRPVGSAWTRLLDEAIAHSRAEVKRHAARLMTDDLLTGGVVASPVNVYRGSAGMGMELLHQGDDESARRLAYWTGGFQARGAGRPGLYTGSTGIALFIAATGAALGDETLISLAEPMARPVLSQVTDDDQHNGLAGIGTGQLLLWHITRDNSRLDIARGCAERLGAGDPLEGLYADPPDYADCGSVSRTLGFSHGLAGVIHFLLAYRTATEDDAVDPVLRKRCDALAQHMTPLLGAARSASAKPMHASFCQGLAGIGASLARAARDLGDDDHLDLARSAAAVCQEMAPRMYALTQCCGLAGIGEFFLDLVQVTGDQADLRRAERVADLILARAGGTAGAPVFPDTSLHESSGGWSTATAGVLSFLRRLRSPGAPRLWLDPPAVG